MRSSLLIFPFVFAAFQSLSAAPSWESVYEFSEMKSVPFEKLARGEVIGVRTQLEGSELSLGAESFYAIPLQPDDVLKKMGGFSAANLEASETLDVKTHLPVGNPPKAGDFSKFSLNTDAKNARWLLQASNNGASRNTGFNLSASEADSIAQANGATGRNVTAESAEKVAQAWRNVFSNRALIFQKSGLLKSEPYDDGKHSFDPGKETLRALKSRPKILQAFGGVLDPVMVGRAIPDAKAPVFYWENSTIQGDQTISLAALFSQPYQGGYRVAEVTYYATGKYYISLVLYQLIPVEIQGKPGTLIYRSDFVLTPSILYIKGIERIAAENILLLEIKKSIRSFMTECGAVPH